MINKLWSFRDITGLTENIKCNSDKWRLRNRFVANFSNLRNTWMKNYGHPVGLPALWVQRLGH